MHRGRAGRDRSHRWGVLLVSTLLAAGIALPARSAESTPAGPLEITVLGNRADLVSGGDALVDIAVPAGVDATRLRVQLDGRDISDAFAERANGRVQGLVTELRVGENELVARARSAAASLTITNHPIGGPVFSGPHVEPWTCAGDAQDDDCNRPPTHRYLYKSTDGGTLADYDPDDPPADVATTTTDEGNEVPFIVREETGVIARDEYRVAVLYDPAQPWEPWAPQSGYNRKLVINHGASCDTSYAMGSAPDVLNEAVLSKGFAVMSHALDNAGHNCNIVTQAESLVMTKEHVAETYGPVRYTIGSGCSGGALAQQQVANAYPGIYQGITPACSYPDAWTSAMQYVDYDGLLQYFQDPGRWSPGTVWEPLQIAQVLGHPNPANPVTFTTVIPNSGKPSRSCPGVPAEDVYDAETNPGGVRCTLHDYMKNVFGTDPETGFALRPADNVGIMYGLEGLMAGTLLPQQFVDVNTKIGGVDADYNPTEERAPGDDLAIERAYRSGAVNTAEHLDEVAIIDMRGPDPGVFHDVYRTYALRERLLREHGTADNQVLWRGTVPILGDITFTDDGIFAMDRWLAAVEQDERDLPLAQKIIDARDEAEVVDRCTSGLGQDVPALYCEVLVQRYATPRIAAGMPTTDDVLECELKPLRRADFPGVLFTDAQWEELQSAYPTGVCDYTKPDPNRVETLTWLTYAGGPGGQPLGDPPRSQPLAADDGTDERHGRFDALAYNVAGLPEALSGSEPTTNSPLISPLLNDYDVVLLQEDWADPLHDAREAGLVGDEVPPVMYHHLVVRDAEHPHRSDPAQHPYGTDLRRAPTGPPLNSDGLNRLSQFPFGSLDRVMWEACHGELSVTAAEEILAATGVDDLLDEAGFADLNHEIDGGSADCGAQKGFSMARTELAPGVTVDVYNLHADAGGHERDEAAREHNFAQLAAYVLEHSAGRAIVLGGDTNLKIADPDRPSDAEVWSTFLAATGLADVCQAVDCGADDAVIDKFAFRSGDDVTIEPESHSFEREKFTRADGTPLSDHDALAVTFRWLA